MNSTFCAINLFNKNNELINRDGRPIMFIWNGVDSLKNSLNVDDFYEFINKHKLFDTLESYSKSNLKSFTYLLDNEETYNDVDLTIQDIFPLNEHKDLCEKYIFELINILWNKVFKVDFENVKSSTYIASILHMFNQIKEKYKDKVLDETIIQAVRSELQTNLKYKKLNKENNEFLIENLKNIINGK